MRIGIIIPRFVSDEECWGESLLGMELADSIQHIKPEARVKLFDPSNLPYLDESYDLVISLWNNPKLNEALSYMKTTYKIYYLVSAPTNMKWLFDPKTNPYDLTLSLSRKCANYMQSKGMYAQWLLTGVNTRLFHYIPHEKAYNFCFLGNYDNPRRKESFDKWLKPFQIMGNLAVMGKGWNDNGFDPQYAINYRGNITQSFEHRSAFYSQSKYGLAIQNQDMLLVNMPQNRIFDLMPCCQYIITNMTYEQLAENQLDCWFIIPFEEMESDIVTNYDNDHAWIIQRESIIKEEFNMDNTAKTILNVLAGK